MGRYSGWEADKDHVFALAGMIYDNMDMIDQETWFDVYDEHVAPLIDSMQDHASDMRDGGKAWEALEPLVNPCPDSFFQEDYFDLSDAAVTFAAVFGDTMGTEVQEELVETYPYFFDLSEE